MRRGIIVIFNLIMSLLFLTSCGAPKNGEEAKEYFAYYVNVDGNDIGAASVGKSDPGGEKMLKLLYENPKRKKNLKVVLGNTVSLNSAEFAEKKAVLDFDASYNDLSRSQEVLFRASVVRSLCQCGDVDFVSFEVDGEPLMDSKGSPVGMMNNETFIYSVGNEFNAYSRTTLTLYFSNATGNALVPVERDVVYSTNVSKETLVIQKLIEGPDAGNKEILPTLPADTKLMSISIKDGICYVSLDSEAAMSPNNISEETALYSIVNSLTQLPGIVKVQLSINGDVDRNFRDKLPLNSLYEKNTEIIEK
ncbi:MAG: GerMN domain-containing protein [Lachnospiraceae bacterium]|nr:GerMN domain-containing protein [Lachnospiraceae bacterium]